MMNPPREGDPSFPVYDKEKNEVLGSLRRRARILVDSMRKLEGVEC